jgi:hypothetical protein
MKVCTIEASEGWAEYEEGFRSLMLCSPEHIVKEDDGTWFMISIHRCKSDAERKKKALECEDAQWGSTVGFRITERELKETG